MPAMRALYKLLLPAMLILLSMSSGLVGPRPGNRRRPSIGAPSLSRHLAPGSTTRPVSLSRRAIRKREWGNVLTALTGMPLLSVYARPNEAGDTPAELSPHTTCAMIDPRWDTSGSPVRFSRFLQERGGLIYYSRCNFSGRTSGSIHCFDLVYPQGREARVGYGRDSHQPFTAAA